jgi:hypothetical protein
VIALVALLTVLLGGQVIPPKADTLTRDSLPGAAAPGGQMNRMLSSEEFVTHIVSLTRLMEESANDWALFKKKREEYLSSHGLTPDLLASFVRDQQKEPEFWSTLWDTIQMKLLESRDQNSSPGDSASLPLDRSGGL